MRLQIGAATITYQLTMPAVTCSFCDPPGIIQSLGATHLLVIMKSLSTTCLRSGYGTALLLLILAVSPYFLSGEGLREPDREAKMRVYRSEHVPGTESPLLSKGPTYLRQLQNVTRPIAVPLPTTTPSAPSAPPVSSVTRPSRPSRPSRPIGRSSARAGIMYAYNFQRPDRRLHIPEAIQLLASQGMLL